MQAIILAGGRGQRLDPFTRILPKPLFPLGDEAMAAILVRQLKGAGVEEIIMSLGYLADLMIAYFQDGRRFGIPIRYIVESEPLGTAGPLKRVDGLGDDFLVVNADELTNLDFRALFAYHLSAQATMTVAVQKKNIASAFGVLEIREGQVIAYREKPTFDYWASMGIYVLNKQCLHLIPVGESFDMPQLVQRLLQVKARVLSYESRDVWYDIGTLGDLERARQALSHVEEIQAGPACAGERIGGLEPETLVESLDGVLPNRGK
ncbi:MAG: sugar phosphate nucleotidyltransferase [Desulfitobacteriaceae bacterium]|nr:sugar phosphate nucleotidyltransferase [Desulfitobacteriaceae bacterium]MDI6880236.1 sugar phosphate nucleotidyltransferase [Desulfitobacteriaceae bacterium]MDI6915570.1 sugar phosphate nucleotidyltransferase [Desulfitobacteriaceae bacterium]